ncbi:hypothetical protein ABIA33_002847 [Streptacidiphilus sp. MAP12-16]|uniref:hypothetical protein n=1 Tax=Streptacidiphilus sp. MAP12-16 TaxID=3156300 RepID=UPI003517CFC3
MVSDPAEVYGTADVSGDVRERQFMTSRPRNSQSGPRAARTQGRTQPQPPPYLGSTEMRVLKAHMAFVNRLPKPYRRIPQPWHFIAKLATVAAFAYAFWGAITEIVSAILSLLLLLGIGAFALAMIGGMFKHSVSEEGREEEERWYEENDPRGNGPSGAI